MPIQRFRNRVHVIIPQKMDEPSAADRGDAFGNRRYSVAGRLRQQLFLRRENAFSADEGADSDQPGDRMSNSNGTTVANGHAHRRNSKNAAENDTVKATS